MNLMPSPEEQAEARYWQTRIAQVEAERDRAIRQRDHARAVATLLGERLDAENWGNAEAYLGYVAAPTLPDADDDGWRIVS